MKNITAVIIILSTLISIGGIILNFSEFLMGGPATIENVVVTIIYLTMWIFISIISVVFKARGIIKYCSIFWAINLLLGILSYANFIDIPVSGALAFPFGIIFFGQLYGIRYFARNYIAFSIVVIFIALVMFLITFTSLKGIKQDKTATIRY